MIDDEKFDPYKVLFPIGCFVAVLGVFFWILFQHRLISFFPRQSHANLMFFGFMWSFIAGFLMTAIPKMTRTREASGLEITLASFLVFLQLVMNVRNLMNISVSLYAVQILFLIYFVTRRILSHKRIPFEGFLFMPFAFLQALFGVGYLFLADSPRIDFFYLLAGEAFVLNLIMGIGTRLIPVLSRVPNALAPNIAGRGDQKSLFLILAIILNLGFALQYWSDLVPFGIGLRLAVLVFISFKFFKVFQRGLAASMLALGLKCGVLLIIASYIFALSSPTSVLAGQHILYIGGFVLITFMVATRVMLSHGGQSLEYEISSKLIGTVGFLFILSAALRLLAGTQITGTMMSLSIYAVLLGIAIWFYNFLKILLAAKD